MFLAPSKAKSCATWHLGIDSSANSYADPDGQPILRDYFDRESVAATGDFRPHLIGQATLVAGAKLVRPHYSVELKPDSSRWASGP